MKAAATKTLCGRVESYLAFTQDTLGLATVRAEKYVLKKNIFFIDQFITYLRKSGSKHSTVYNVLLDLERWALYCAAYLGRKEGVLICSLLTTLSLSYNYLRRVLDITRSLPCL